MNSSSSSQNSVIDRFAYCITKEALHSCEIEETKEHYFTLYLRNTVYPNKQLQTSITEDIFPCCLWTLYPNSTSFQFCSPHCSQHQTLHGGNGTHAHNYTQITRNSNSSYTSFFYLVSARHSKSTEVNIS